MRRGGRVCVFPFSSRLSDHTCLTSAGTVGGEVFDAVLPLLNIGARAGPRRDCALLAMSAILQKRVRMQGFIILDHFGERFDRRYRS